MKSFGQLHNILEDTWTVEFLALFGSLSSLAIIIILLAIYDNSAVFNWDHVTLNAIVSVLSTASKGLLLLAVSEAISQQKWITFSKSRHQLIEFEHIDGASRGPLGCAQALLKRSGGLGMTIGATVVLLAVAVDPFMQQLIQFQSRLQYSNSEDVFLPLATRYSKGSQYITFPIVYMDGWTVGNYTDERIAGATADFAMQSAILFGLSNSQQQIWQQLQVTCPSGNCTWGPAKSLAVCSKCQDLHHQLNITWLAEEDPLSTDLVGTTAEGAPPVTTFSLPNGLYINNADNDFDAGTAMLMTAWSTSNSADTISFQSLNELLWSISFINVTGPWSNDTIQATECALYYCVNEYTTTLSNGTLSETASPVPSATRSPRSWQPGVGTYWSSHDSLTFDPMNSTINRTDLMIGDGFNVSQAAIDGINSFFQSTFTVNLTDQLFSLSGEDTFPAISGYAMNWTYAQDFQPNIMQAFYQSPDFTETFANLASSMTNALRAGADLVPSGPSGAYGQNGVMVTHYVIQWPWITLPSILIIAGYICLWICLIQSRKARVPIWKSSSIAVLAKGSYVKDRLNGSGTPSNTTISVLNERAEQVYVQFGTENPSMSTLSSKRDVNDWKAVVSSSLSVQQPTQGSHLAQHEPFDFERVDNVKPDQHGEREREEEEEAQGEEHLKRSLIEHQSQH